MEINKIYQGDCLDILDKIDTSKAIFVSDPPFNIGYKYDVYKDDLSEDDYYEWLQSVFGVNRQVIIHYPEQLYKYAFQVGLFPERVVS